jgi:hypothetical protein
MLERSKKRKEQEMRTTLLTVIMLIIFNLANTSFAVDLTTSEQDSLKTIDEIRKVNLEEAVSSRLPTIRTDIARDFISRGGSYTSGVTATDIGSKATERIHVIPTKEITKKDLGMIKEDMNIMCHLLYKELKPSYRSARVPYGSLYDDMSSHNALLSAFLGIGSQKIEGIYLEGYGALFMITVDFPLSAPPELKTQQREPKEEIDSIWEQAKQEIYNKSGEIKTSVDSPPPDVYDANKVEYLKEKLAKALKYAANIRKLEPDNTVVITVKGRKLTEESPSNLTMRTKKSEIDAFSQGESDFKQFQQRVSVLVY